MPIFAYTGLNAKGLKVKGFIESSNKQEALFALKEKEVYATDIVLSDGLSSASSSVILSSSDYSSSPLASTPEVSSSTSPSVSTVKTNSAFKISFKESFKLNLKDSIIKLLNTKIEKKPSQTDIIMFFKELYSLINSGIPLYDAIYEQKSDVKNNYFKKILSEISLNIKEGKSFSDCLSVYPSVFPSLIVSSVKAGEESGSLAPVLNKITAYSEEKYNTVKKIKASLIYPLIMTVVGFLILFYIVVYVVPIISKIFKSMHHVLPLPTRIVLFGSFLFSHYLILFLLLILAVYIFFKKYINTAKGRRNIDGMLLKIPVVGKFIILSEVNLFSQSLSMLLTSGINLNRAIFIASSNFRNTLLKEAILDANKSLEEGNGLSGPLYKSNLYPPIFLKMVKAGEKSSNIEEMLLTASNIMKSEIDFYIISLTSALEPAMVIFMGLMVGFIVISIMLPIFEMSSLINK